MRILRPRSTQSTEVHVARKKMNTFLRTECSHRIASNIKRMTHVRTWVKRRSGKLNWSSLHTPLSSLFQMETQFLPFQFFFFCALEPIPLPPVANSVSERNGARKTSYYEESTSKIDWYATPTVREKPANIPTDLAYPTQDRDTTPGHWLHLHLPANS